MTHKQPFIGMISEHIIQQEKRKNEDLQKALFQAHS